MPSVSNWQPLAEVGLPILPANIAFFFSCGDLPDSHRFNELCEREYVQLSCYFPSTFPAEPCVCALPYMPLVMLCNTEHTERLYRLSALSVPAPLNNLVCCASDRFPRSFTF